MDLSLQGRHALVGGATRGIGRATAETLASLGASVTGIARSPDALKDMVNGLPRAHGQQHGFIAADSAQPDALAASVRTTSRMFMPMSFAA